MYRSFGKAYIRSDKEDLLQRLRDVEKASEEELGHLRSRKSIIESTIGQLDEQQAAIRQAMPSA
jgi:chaperonin cofactor prefoldin